jgi:N-methylhydantoinase A
MSFLSLEQSEAAAKVLRIGVDVGGTFTDLVCFDPDSGELRIVKIPSTPPDFEREVIEAVRHVSGPEAVAEIVHGSTVATNARLERKREPVAFVTTHGFRDMLLIGRQNRPDLYALRVVRPRPLTAEENWFTVRERIDARGEIIEPLEEREIDSLVENIRTQGLRHVAVCLLFSFINPVHEQRIAKRCEAAGLTVSLSSDVLPEFREYERASTTVINAALRPKVREYLAALRRGLGEGSGFRVQGSGEEGTTGQSDEGTKGAEADSPRSSVPLGPSRNPEPRTLNPSLRIMHSAGGTLSVQQAAASAARLVLSGPAGGVIGAAFVARHEGFEDVITYDMGGTSTDVATILSSRPQWTTSTTIDGLPIGLPMFDIQTVGAGGGSIAYLDAGGALRVGPRSAGAMPGPAC